MNGILFSISNKELLYLYLPKEQVGYMKKLLNPEGRIAKEGKGKKETKRK